MCDFFCILLRVFFPDDVTLLGYRTRLIKLETRIPFVLLP